jgi:microcystin-dependent protein
MGGTTPSFALPYPAATDPADVPKDVKALADRLEVVLAALQAATPPAASPGDLKTVGYPVAAGSEGTQCPGWLLCDGRAVSRSTYADLFAKIGTAHGPGDGSATFNLPDARGRSPMGAGTGSGLTARTLGAKLGEEGTTITVGQMPSHGHTGKTSAGKTAAGVTGPGTLAAHATNAGTTGSGNVNHQHTSVANVGFLMDARGGAAYASAPDPAAYPNQIHMAANWADQPAGAAHQHAVPSLVIPAQPIPALSIPQLDVPQLDITAEGGDGAHNTVHPCFVVHVLIKT